MKTGTKQRKAGQRTSSKKTNRTVASRQARAVARAPAVAVNPKWAWHYRKLLALRTRLQQESARKLRDAAESIEPHSMHPADSATDEFEHDVALTLLSRDEDALTDVNDAITRILEGRYGVCEESGARIPALRLRVLPWCRYTREVEQRLERTGKAAKSRVPGTVSLRGAAPQIPGTGVLPREGEDTEPAEPAEGDVARIVEAVSTPDVADIEAVGRGDSFNASVSSGATSRAPGS